MVFHAGTAEHDGALVAAGGRVLNVSATGRRPRRGPRPRLLARST